jgi:hypothetical protein
MRIVYRGRDVADARSARDVLESVGLAAHIADPDPSGAVMDGQDLDAVRVMVDNRCFDQARRVMERWTSGRRRDEARAKGEEPR